MLKRLSSSKPEKNATVFNSYWYTLDVPLLDVTYAKGTSNYAIILNLG